MAFIVTWKDLFPSEKQENLRIKQNVIARHCALISRHCDLYQDIVTYIKTLWLISRHCDLYKDIVTYIKTELWLSKYGFFEWKKKKHFYWATVSLVVMFSARKWGKS